MFAYTVQKNLNLNQVEFKKITTTKPQPEDYDLLIEVKAVSVNPVDYKIAANIKNNETDKVLGWDAAGIVVGKGKAVKNYNLGDEVYYAGDLTRPGTNAQYHLVDERIVGRKPQNLSFKEAAAIPLTGITAYEALFEHLTLEKAAGKTILLIGAAGGVGSIAIQLLKNLTQTKVIATASRKESMEWVKSLGADIIIDHNKNFLAELQKHDIHSVDYIFCINGIEQHFDKIVEAIRPFGKICAIDDPAEKLDMLKLKWKSVSFSWEFMFTHSMFKTYNMQSQGQLLNKISQLIEQGKLKTTIGLDLGIISEKQLELAHTHLQSGKTLGKIVLEMH